MHPRRSCIVICRVVTNDQYWFSASKLFLTMNVMNFLVSSLFIWKKFLFINTHKYRRGEEEHLQFHDIMHDFTSHIRDVCIAYHDRDLLLKRNQASTTTKNVCKTIQNFSIYKKTLIIQIVRELHQICIKDEKNSRLTVIMDLVTLGLVTFNVRIVCLYLI